MSLPASESVPSCEHGVATLRYRSSSNGIRMYVRQCTECGQAVTTWLKVSTLSAAEIADATPFDDVLRQTWNARLVNAYADRWMDEKTRRDCEWQIEYARYIRSPEWSARRKKVFERAGKIGLALPVCEGCGERPAVEVHHKTYANFGKEPLWDLAAVCEWCHDQLHAANRG